MHDALACEDRGIPIVFLPTEPFMNAALDHAEACGNPDCQALQVRYPLASLGDGRGRDYAVSLGVDSTRAGERLDAESGALRAGLSVPPRPWPEPRLVGGCGSCQAAATSPSRIDESRGQSAAWCARRLALDHGEPL